jgi:hypothetical protein
MSRADNVTSRAFAVLAQHLKMSCSERNQDSTVFVEVSGVISMPERDCARRGHWAHPALQCRLSPRWRTRIGVSENRVLRRVTGGWRKL